MVWSSIGEQLLDDCKIRSWLCEEGCGTAYRGHAGYTDRYQWHSTGCNCPVPSFASRHDGRPAAVAAHFRRRPHAVAAAAAARALGRLLQLWGDTELQAPVDVAVSSGYAFVVTSSEHGGERHRADAADGVGHVTPLSNAVRVAVKKDWVFVAENTAESDGSKLIAIDTAIKEMPEMITTLTMPPDVQDIAYPGGEFLFAVVGGLPSEWSSSWTSRL